MINAISSLQNRTFSIISADKGYYDYRIIVGDMKFDFLGNSCDPDHNLDTISENGYFFAINTLTGVKNK